MLVLNFLYGETKLVLVVFLSDYLFHVQIQLQTILTNEFLDSDLNKGNWDNVIVVFHSVRHGHGTMVHLNINPFLLKLSISGILATLKRSFVPCRSGSVP